MSGPVSDSEHRSEITSRLRGIIEQEEFQSHASITELGDFFIGRYFVIVLLMPEIYLVGGGIS